MPGDFELPAMLGHDPCSDCCGCGGVGFVVETQTVILRKWGAIYKCVGDPNFNKVYRQVVQTSLGNTSGPPPCGGQVSYHVITPFQIVPYRDLIVWGTSFGAPIGLFNHYPGVSATATATSVTGSHFTGTGDVIQNTYSDEITDAELYDAVIAGFSAAPWEPGGSASNDFSFLGTEEYTLRGRKSRVKFRHSVPFYLSGSGGTPGRTRGNCFRTTVEVIEVTPADAVTVLSSFEYAWDGVVPEDFNQVDLETYPGLPDWIELPLPTAQENVVSVRATTPVCRCNGP